MTNFFRLQFVFSSFGPLFALMAVVLVVQDRPWGAAVAGLLALCAFVTFLALATGMKRKSPSFEVVRVDARLDQHVLSHLISYLPPVLMDDFGTVETIVPVFAFYAIIVLLMLRADSIYVNPFFLWCGYRVHQVRLENDRSVVIVTRRTSTITGDRLALYEVDATRLYFAE